MRSPFEGTRFVAMAHRGGSIPGVTQGRENTLVAFAAAVGLGYRFLETDVHATRDGHAVVFHDDRLERVTDARGLIADLPFDQVRAASIGGEQIPTLDELLDSFPEAVFNIDLKSDPAVELVAAAIIRHRAQHRVCIGSFHQRRLRRFRRLTHGTVATSIGPWGAFYGLVTPGLPGLLPPTGVAYQVPVSWQAGGLSVRLVTASSVRAAHRAGQQVHVWTVNDAPTMARLIELGVDGIITDEVELLAQVLQTKGMTLTGEPLGSVGNNGSSPNVGHNVGDNDRRHDG